jgi:innexin
MSYLIVNIERYISARAHMTARHAEKRLSCLRRFCHHVLFCCKHHYGNYLVIIYFLVKLMWLVNSLAQLFLLNAFLGNEYYLFGFEVIEKLLKNQRWTENRHFPKVTYWYVEYDCLVTIP